MRFGLLGLGRMGSSLALNALDKGNEVVGFDPNPGAGADLRGRGWDIAASIDQLAQRLPPPRVAMLYVPHGSATDLVVTQLINHFSPGDIIADGGNSHWDDSIRHYHEAAAAGIRFL